MIKKNKSSFIVKFLLTFFIIIFSLSFAVDIFAKINDWGATLGRTRDKTGYIEIDNAESGIAKYTGNVLFIVSVLGFIFLIQLVLAGYEWMTAQGNEEKVADAQKRIIYAVIGIVILAILYTLAQFIIFQLAGATKYKI